VSAYYNEIDPYAAHWLRNLIAAGLIPDGEVDERSIEVVEAADLRQFRQCHFFAGIGGWAYAARLAGWPDDRELWTGSLPCQPYSVGGLQRGHDDPRDLWSHQIRLVRECRPLCWMGEQVAAAIGKGWLDRLFDDLEAIGYACGATVVQACAAREGKDWSRAEVLRALDNGTGVAKRICSLSPLIPSEQVVGLNPSFAGWLMGYPAEWIACAPSRGTATPLSRKSPPK
jgi:site-specific DNA-cytosine methylase